MMSRYKDSPQDLEAVHDGEPPMSTKHAFAYTSSLLHHVHHTHAHTLTHVQTPTSPEDWESDDNEKRKPKRPSGAYAYAVDIAHSLCTNNGATLHSGTTQCPVEPSEASQRVWKCAKLTVLCALLFAACVFLSDCLEDYELVQSRRRYARKYFAVQRARALNSSWYMTRPSASVGNGENEALSEREGGRESPPVLALPQPLLTVSQEAPSQTHATARTPLRVRLTTHTLNASILRPAVRARLDVYLTALYNGVHLAELPLSDTLLNALHDCERDREHQQALLSHQHSVELRFPVIMQEMDYYQRMRNSNSNSVNSEGETHAHARETLYFRLLHTHSAAHNAPTQVSSPAHIAHAQWQLLSHKVFRTPLFHYLHTFHYLVAHCSFTPSDPYSSSTSAVVAAVTRQRKQRRLTQQSPAQPHTLKNPESLSHGRSLSALSHSHSFTATQRGRREDWNGALVYWKEVSAALPLHLAQEWRTNRGADFLVCASHPKSGPTGLDPAPLNDLGRASFLRTDYDVHGHGAKDVIVPYFVSPMSWDVIHKAEEELALRKANKGEAEAHLPPERLLVVFLGGDNPKHGYRSRLEQAFISLNDSRVFFTVTQKVPYSEYLSRLLQSDFCLSVRGDTSSSSRLFSILSLDGLCIPVIIADDIVLPFDEILDYSSFSLQFPESVVDNVGEMVRVLAAVSETERERLRKGVREARQMLLYEQAVSVRDREGGRERALGRAKKSVRERELSVLNPVSLALVQMLMRKHAQCLSLGDAARMSDLCVKIFKRLEIAEHVVRSREV